MTLRLVTVTDIAVQYNVELFEPERSWAGKAEVFARHRRCRVFGVCFGASRVAL